MLFLAVGFLTVLIDFVSYRALIRFEVFAVDTAKAVGFLSGSVFAYFANRFWTFNHRRPAPGGLWRFVVLYTSTLVPNVLINSLVLALMADTVGSIQLAFIFATGISASLNFLGMKNFVFTSCLISELE